jgi:phosphatidylglycerophosphate synthase
VDVAKLPSLLSASRFLLGPIYVAALARLAAAAGDPWSLGSHGGGAGMVGAGGSLGLPAPAVAAPLVVAGLASLSDFVDGRLARRLGAASPAGAALDVSADALFVLLALGALAAVGLLSWLLPLAAAAALAALALRWNRRSPARGEGPRRLADRAGHWAGIANYGAILVASGVPLGWVAVEWLPAASRCVALLNLAPIALSVLPPRRRSP